jgi:hypothetical protein
MTKQVNLKFTQRFSVIPSRAVFDKQLSPLDVRVLALLGVMTDRTGWCYANQRKMAESIGVARETVNRSLSKLYKFGYVQAHDINIGKRGKHLRSINVYRVIMDEPIPPSPSLEDDDFDDDIFGASYCDNQVSTDELAASQLNNPIRTTKKDSLIKNDFDPSAKSGKPVEKVKEKEAQQEAQLDIEDAIAAVPPAEQKYDPKFLRWWSAIPRSGDIDEMWSKWKRVNAYPLDFQEWWEMYPRKVGKGKAYAAWKRLSADEREWAFKAIYDTAVLAELQAEMNRDGGNFCPHPATWLNSKRFDDYAERG